MPKPKPDETQGDFVQRCIPIVIRDGTAEDGQQAAAICHSIWREAKSMNEELLAAIRERQEKLTEWNYGILTADRYVKTLQDCVGSRLCYRHAASKHVSFQDVLTKASKTLTYCNDEMAVKDIYGDKAPQNGLDLDLPKNTLMVFRHVLTTPKKDRDGDILRTQGAQVDPKMLLLWQHVHTLPIGKLLTVASQSSKSLEVISAIVDMNELSHDAAVMVDNKMGRFSHGFKALEFEKIKEDEGDTTKPVGGFDVKIFEIMEESLVSVPSNTDADTQEILVSLVEGGKLTSPIMKEYGKALRNGAPKMASVGIDLNLTINGEKVNADEPGNRSVETERAGAKGQECSCGASKEADGDGDKEGEADNEKMMVFSGTVSGSWEYIEHKLRDQAKDFLVGSGISVGKNSWVALIATFADKAILCHEKDDGKAQYYRAGWKMEGDDPEFFGSPKEVTIEHETRILEKAAQSHKAGRVLSQANLNRLIDVKEDLAELDKSHVSTRAGSALCKGCAAKLDTVIKAAMPEDEGKNCLSDAIAVVIAEADEKQRDDLIRAFNALKMPRIRVRKGTSKIRKLIKGKV